MSCRPGITESNLQIGISMRRGVGGTCPARMAGREMAKQGLLPALLDPLLPENIPPTFPPPKTPPVDSQLTSTELHSRPPGIATVLAASPTAVAGSLLGLGASHPLEQHSASDKAKLLVADAPGSCTSSSKNESPKTIIGKTEGASADVAMESAACPQRAPSAGSERTLFETHLGSAVLPTLHSVTDSKLGRKWDLLRPQAGTSAQLAADKSLGATNGVHNKLEAGLWMDKGKAARKADSDLARESSEASTMFSPQLAQGQGLAGLVKHWASRLMSASANAAPAALLASASTTPSASVSTRSSAVENPQVLSELSSQVEDRGQSTSYCSKPSVVSQQLFKQRLDAHMIAYGLGKGQGLQNTSLQALKTKRIVASVQPSFSPAMPGSCDEGGCQKRSRPEPDKAASLCDHKEDRGAPDSKLEGLPDPKHNE